MIRDRGTKHTHVSIYIHTQHPLHVSVLEGPPARVRVGSTPARVSIGSTPARVRGHNPNGYATHDGECFPCRFHKNKLIDFDENATADWSRLYLNKLELSLCEQTNFLALVSKGKTTGTEAGPLHLGLCLIDSFPVGRTLIVFDTSITTT